MAGNVPVVSKHHRHQPKVRSSMVSLMWGTSDPGARVRGCCHSIMTCNLKFHVAAARPCDSAPRDALHLHFSFSASHSYLSHFSWLLRGLIWTCSFHRPWAHPEPRPAGVFHRHTCSARALAWTLTATGPGLCWSAERNEKRNVITPTFQEACLSQPQEQGSLVGLQNPDNMQPPLGSPRPSRFLEF